MSIARRSEDGEVTRMQRLTAMLSVAIVVVLGLGAGAAYLVGTQRGEGGTGTPVPVADSVVRPAEGLIDDPRTAEIVSLFQRHFDAINERDHAAWARTVDPDDAAGRPEGVWLTEYASTTDENIALVSLATEPLRARITFTSRQDITDAPPTLPVDCINWAITYLLVGQTGELLIGDPEPGTADREAC